MCGRWNRWITYSVFGGFFLVDFAFFSSNALKIPSGGWFPLAMGLAIFLLMATWKKGRLLVWNKLRPASMPLEMFLDDIERNREVPRVPGTALFMTANPEGTPIALLHNLKHNGVLHQMNAMVSAAFQQLRKR